MKKFIVLGLSVAVSLLLWCQPSLAQQERNFGLGARVSYYNIDTGVVVGRDPDIDSSVLYGINLTYFFSDAFSLELSGEYTKADVNVAVTGFVGKTGELTQVPVLLTARLHVPGKTISPYVGGGLGYYFHDFDSAAGRSDFRDVDNSFGYHVAGGIEVFFAKHFGLNLDLKYIWNKADFTRGSGGTSEIDLDAIVAGLGVKYYF